VTGLLDDAGAVPYSVRVSSRARHVRLTVTARDGLVVVVPAGVLVDAGALVESRRDWALRALAGVAEKRAQFAAGPDALLPARVDLAACGASLSVRYEVSPQRCTARSRTGGETIFVTGAAQAEARLRALRRWLDRAARDFLPQRLAELSATSGLGYSAVRVTSARSRWGSCSARGTISLNRTLMFVPAELCDAVLLHELAHTKVLDHSARFWTLLSTIDPDAKAHRAALRKAGELVPAWAEG